MTQGTKSFLFGCHQFLLHPYFILKAWKFWYGKYPNWREIVCIFIHDIGIIGLDYLEKGRKDGHWNKGALLVKRLFGRKYFNFCAGHTDEWHFLGSELLKDKTASRSKLFIPDKISYLFCPLWWLKWCTYLEGFLKRAGVSHLQWREMVKQNMIESFPKGSHRLFSEIIAEREERRKAGVGFDRGNKK